MIKFRKQKQTIEVVVKVEQEQAPVIQQCLQNLSDSLTKEQLVKLSALCNNPLLKTIALNKLEEYIP